LLFQISIPAAFQGNILGHCVPSHPAEQTAMPRLLNFSASAE
jgi:hypothetical protein